jgi:hypothetical protein
MNEPTYTNKAEQPAPRILHKSCGGEVKRIPGGRMRCAKCKQYIDAVECYHEETVKDNE